MQHPFSSSLVSGRKRIQLLLFVGVTLVGIVLGWQLSESQMVARPGVARTLEEAQARLASLQGENARLERQAQIDRSAAVELQQQMGELVRVQQGLKRELGIYRMVSSESEAGLRVHSFRAEKGAAGGYVYQVALTQGASASERVSGLLSLLLPTDGTALIEVAFDFRYLQLIEGRLELPDGIQPTTILLKLQPESGPAVEQLLSWPEGHPVGRVGDVEQG